MPDLAPIDAANIAKHVYSVRAEDDMQTAFKMSQGLGLNGMFDVTSSQRMSGSSGAMWFRSTTGFGYGAPGLGNRQGELLIATRGTHFSSVHDWLTNANMALRPGPSGWPVHAGFKGTFETMRGQIDTFMRGRNPSVVHCVGHSLGGALATLIADYLDDCGAAEVKLYTFGSPRVGALGFSRNLTGNLGENNCFRVYHTADPVPMLPIFPFAHVPAGGLDCGLPWPGRIAKEAHDMERYIASCRDSGWSGLRTPPLAPNWQSEVQAWMDASQGNVIAMSAAGFAMIGMALHWLVKKILKMGIGVGLLAAATAIDFVAQILYYGVAASIEIASWVGTLIKRIFQFLGRAVVAIGNISVTFLRWLLTALLQTVGIAARAALISAIPVGTALLL